MHGYTYGRTCIIMIYTGGLVWPAHLLNSYSKPRSLLKSMNEASSQTTVAAALALVQRCARSTPVEYRSCTLLIGRWVAEEEPEIYSTPLYVLRLHTLFP